MSFIISNILTNISLGLFLSGNLYSSWCHWSIPCQNARFGWQEKQGGVRFMLQDCIELDGTNGCLAGMIHIQRPWVKFRRNRNKRLQSNIALSQPNTPNRKDDRRVMGEEEVCAIYVFIILALCKPNDVYLKVVDWSTWGKLFNNWCQKVDVNFVLLNKATILTK